MGDWEDGKDAGLWGDDGIPYGIDSPCWNDDWEQELLSNGYQTVNDWNLEGRSVKKGEKGTYLPCARMTVFNESQTIPSKRSNKGTEAESDFLRAFGTYEEAMSWAKSNPGKVIKRSPNGNGFVAKK